MSNWQTPKTNWGQPGQTVPGVDDFNRIEGNIETLGRYDRTPGYGTATGTNAKTITLNPAPGSYYDGLCFAFKNATQNTGAVTINVNGLGARSIKKPNGNDVAAGNLKAGSVYTVRYNGTNFILQGSDSAGNAMPEHVLAGKTFSNDNGPDQVGTMPNQGQKIIVPGTTNIIIPRGYHDGTGYVEGSPNLLPENIKAGVSLWGIAGTYMEKIVMGEQDTTDFWHTPDGGSGSFGFLYITNLPFTPHFIYAMHVTRGAHNFFIACDGNYGGLPKFQIKYADKGTITDNATRIGEFVDENTEYYKDGRRVYIGFQSNYIALYAGLGSYKYIILG